MGRRKKMFKTDENGTMYLYEYFSLMEKADEISRIVYCIFKKMIRRITITGVF